MTATRYPVAGMTCEHCIRAVSTEIAQLPGVTDVQVDLSSSQVTVTHEGQLDDTAVSEAVDEAGYQVVTTR